jgi:hypothetical protein
MSVFLPIPCRNNASDLSLSLTFDPVLVTLQVLTNCVTSVPTDMSVSKYHSYLPIKSLCTYFPTI